MPHFTIEYSANLDGRVNFQSLCTIVRDEILKTGLFEVGAVRVRAFGAQAYAIADLDPRNAFVDMSFRIGVGRSAGDKLRVGRAIMARVSETLQALLEDRYFALSLEIREIDPALSWKANSIHPRLRSAS